MSAPSPRMAVAIVEELIAGGVKDVVLAPGSRSAPLALALADAERRGLVRLHVRIDERSAGYLALGLARVSGDPAAVVTTSGTAAVNLHPAVVEAAYSGVPLVAVTADRPGSMRGTGANQTIEQRDLYGVDVIASVDLEGLDEEPLRGAISRALDTSLSDRPGAIHLNAPFTEPLVRPGDHIVGEVQVRARAPRVAPERISLAHLLPDHVDAGRGILIVGDFDDAEAHQAACSLATVMDWPVISEPSGNLSTHPRALRHGPVVAGSAQELGLLPDVVVTVGRVGLHRSITALLRQATVHIAVDVPPRLGRVDHASTATVILNALPVGAESRASAGWRGRWCVADEAAGLVVESALSESGLTGPVVARAVGEHVGADDLLVLGPSWPVRHVSAYAGPVRARCIGNRGTSGIDGVVSTAWGAAVAHADRHPDGTTYALVGDLTAIYDRNGLLVPAGEQLPRLVIIVADNDGGGIFSSLEQGSADFTQDFDRVFGTPHGGDLTTLLSAPRVPVTLALSVDQLRSALADKADGVRVIVARCQPRVREAELTQSLQAAVNTALM